MAHPSVPFLVHTVIIEDQKSFFGFVDKKLDKRRIEEMLQENIERFRVGETIKSFLHFS